MNISFRDAFTLIELLIVIAIVGILSLVVILVVNPVELLRQARDSNRLSNVNTVERVIGLYQVDNPGASIGSLSTTYLSLIDPTATTTAGTNCAGIGMTAPVNWAYHCAASSTQTATDGTGWIPINLNSVSFGSPLGSLPVEPTNTSSSGLYYTYTSPANTYELTTSMESVKYSQGGSSDKVSTDGGPDDSVYEVGSNLNAQWSSTSLITTSTYNGTSFTGWGNQTPLYLTESVTTPGNGFPGPVLEWDASGGSQGQRDWAVAGAQTTAFALNQSYKIEFFYRANGQFEIHDRDANITVVPANTGSAKEFTYTYLKTSNAWLSPYLLVYLGNSVTVSQVQMSGLRIFPHQ